ncbi:uncharacterized protein C8R40DRAFT_1170736 [Lentinula edodes]|uniref:uncharacterized protein n=1 Tax=Lentinula edodes TaxID=5353 RepID=UPI001E8DAB8A|nr:uncharacterized protein C8R40DRAFT_1170736 [Lentinula edodes]KAH7875110.1 hypothetical protein C8R40DRAFT_1170736 [Lentinula edodes]
MNSDNPNALFESLFGGDNKPKSIDPLVFFELLYGKSPSKVGNTTGGNMGPHKSPASSTSSFAQLSPDLSPGQLPPLPNVDNLLFQVPIQLLAAESAYFRTRMDQNDGLKEENPIQLDTDVSPEDFRQLLRVVCPPKRFNAEPEVFSFGQWISVLKLAKKWDMSEVRAYAISAIRKLPDIDPVDKIVLARTYDIPTWLAPSFNEILQRSQSLTESDVDKLGIPTIVRLMELRDRVRPHIYSPNGAWILGSARMETSVDFTAVICTVFPESQVEGMSDPIDEGIRDHDLDCNSRVVSSPTPVQSTNATGPVAAGSKAGSARALSPAELPTVDPMSQNRCPTPLGSSSKAKHRPEPESTLSQDPRPASLWGLHKAPSTLALFYGVATTLDSSLDASNPISMTAGTNIKNRKKSTK